VNFYRTRSREFGKTWAILNEKNEVVSCDWRQARKWRKTEGEQRSRIKFTRVGLQEIETRFVGESLSVDGPHLFWRVSLRIPTNRRKDPIGQWAIKGEFKESSPFLREGVHFFATLPEALAFHDQIRKECSRQMRLLRAKPEKAQILLAELSDWCAQKWGRQACAAQEVGTTPQTVNDWLSGRKKMTGEQALRIQELLNQEKRHRR
jgi:hypothetical protein